MSEMPEIFAGDDPLEIAQRWLTEAEASEINDPNAMSLATVDPEGMPNLRMVLLKEIVADGVVFYTNYDSVKGQEIEASGKAAMGLHWKSLRRQVRVRGMVERVPEAQSDAYYKSRALQSRLGAWASQQSKPLASKAHLMADVAKLTMQKGPNPARPPYWGGYKITPLEVELWADGAFRLHDRFRWSRSNFNEKWHITRLYP
ncbi:MAG: pyridoxamine 5'-phosphate oxidase [Mangrovicoccus sp.]